VGYPPRLPDITPLDSSFWGRCKQIVYQTTPNTEEELRGRIITAAATVTPEMSRQHRKMRQRMFRRKWAKF
jgi:hypothetical protein